MSEIFVITESEKQRILNLHKNATKNQYLIKEDVTERQRNINNSYCSVKGGKIVYKDSKVLDGMEWTNYVKTYDVTGDEIETAKKSCLNVKVPTTTTTNTPTTDQTQLSSYPKCVQRFGDPTQYKNSELYSIDGGVSTYDWTDYHFFSNYRVRKPDSTMTSYFCRGDEPMLGAKLGPSTGGKTTTAALGGTVLRIGSSGDVVKDVQHKLAAHNFESGNPGSIGGEGCSKDKSKCDGKYGQDTYNAVKKFQELAKITVDGVVGDETYQQLFGGDIPTVATTTTPTTPTATTTTTPTATTTTTTGNQSIYRRNKAEDR